jgi:hypothetical protein
VLIGGRSGAGKSDLALRLIDRGASLVSDDYTELRRVGGRVLARAPAEIAGKIEVRGLGILDLPAAADVPFASSSISTATPSGCRSRRRSGWPERKYPVALAALEASAALKLEQALVRFGLPL